MSTDRRIDDAAASAGAREPGQFLLDLMILRGWQVTVDRSNGVRVLVRRPQEELRVEANGRTLADASFSAHQQACAALWTRRRPGGNAASGPA